MLALYVINTYTQPYKQVLSYLIIYFVVCGWYQVKMRNNTLTQPPFPTYQDFHNFEISITRNYLFLFNLICLNKGHVCKRVSFIHRVYISHIHCGSPFHYVVD